MPCPLPRRADDPIVGFGVRPRRPRGDMTRKPPSDLQAELERLRDENAALRAGGSEEETRRLLHELTVHQTELEAQNAQLREAHGALEASQEIVSLPMFPELSQEQTDYIVAKIAEFRL